MTKADIVKIISQKTGSLREETADIVDAFLETVKESIIDGHHIEIRGFGTMKTKERKETVARNPRTGEKVKIPARKVPTFKFSQDFKEAVNKK
jgi:nucleoid DNA-binding protein